MRSRRFGFWTIGATVLLAALPRAIAHGFEGTPREPATDTQGIRSLTEAIDRLISEKWTESRVQPAALSDDAEYLRRVSLDLIGRIPSVAETRDFLEDAGADKRSRLVESLLKSPAYVNHWTNFWRDLLLPELDTGNQVQVLAPDFDAWLRERVARNAGLDTLARELIAFSLEGTSNRRGINPYQRDDRKPTPLAYYMAKEAKPENLAAGTARTFLGIRIECAQCHDHPFARWKREQFWSYAAFFGGIQKQGPADAFGPVREIPDRRELAIPGTEKVVQAAFLDGGEPQWRFRVGSRVTLADWITAQDNPYFARAGVNRLWAHLFGTGIVDPVDDLSDANPPSHPELLDLLAREFSRHGYDPKFLLRALTASRAYQLTSNAEGASQDDPRLFARMALKGLTADQLYDSIAQATGRPVERNRRIRFQGGGGTAQDFRQKFSRNDEKATETQTSILQALAMMNGQLIGESTNLLQGSTLAAIVSAPFLDTSGKVETLFLATLNRKPRPEELARMNTFLERRKTAIPPSPQRSDPANLLERIAARMSPGLRLSATSRGGQEQALSDILWALLNSSEFLLNH